MFRNLTILGIAAVIIALPFIFRQPPAHSDWKPGDPELVIISPHNEAIRHEFARAFSKWHQAQYGAPVKISWRAIGGTTEIMRYLSAEYISAFRGWWKQQGKKWTFASAGMIFDRRFNPEKPPAGSEARTAWETQREIYSAFRSTDKADAFTCKIDLFFGGGAYDHNKAAEQGMAVAPWPSGREPENTVISLDGAIMIPASLSGELWRSDTFYGTALSTFGICYNLDRLDDLAVARPPRSWDDLANPVYFGQLGAADPTKSGSIAKAFEMIVHQKCFEAVEDAGFDALQIDDFERKIAAAGLEPGHMPEGVPDAYQQAIEQGWLQGIKLIQLIGANARYFTDSASKVPIDVSMGDAAVGLAIDFYGRYQAETSLGPNGEERMRYVTPEGGSSVSADPITLLRGAENRDVALRFIEFVLRTEGQRLWNYRPGTDGGPEKFALRRLPIRRDFYPSVLDEVDARFRSHEPNLTDPLGDPQVNPYVLAGYFTYQPRWTGGHFNVQRDLIRAMCMDAGEELRDAWKAILDHGGPDKQVMAVEHMTQLPDKPVPLNWTTALTIGKQHDRLDIMREWVLFYRTAYQIALEKAMDEGGI